jgi:mono/diheme cytochrome c family protein|tara:strand:+ start:124 stop:441 length:318 start_codon:yes stop_codon:yes gene_type:complete
MIKNLFLAAIIIMFNFFFIIAKSDDKFKIGKKIFMDNGECATCHTLSDAKSNGQIGPNLNQIKPDEIRVLTAVTNGIGVMPSYQGLLTTEEIEAVSYYVSVSVDE